MNDQNKKFFQQTGNDIRKLHKNTKNDNFSSKNTQKYVKHLSNNRKQRKGQLFLEKYTKT